MVKRGRPSLNLSPEERLQRRRLQLVASQRKRRAQKRLAQPSKPATSESQLPVTPTAAALCQFYDAMFAEDAEPQTHGKMPCPEIQPTCTHCGSAPLDMAALTAAVSHASPASLVRTFQLGTDTYALSSRLASPTRWAEYTSANDDQFHPQETFMQAGSHLPPPPFTLGLGSLDSFGVDPDGTALLSGLDTSPKADAAGNVFLPGLSYRSGVGSYWLPSSPPETDSTMDAPALRGSRLCSPPLCGDGVDFITPWAGTKQVSFSWGDCLAGCQALKDESIKRERLILVFTGDPHGVLTCTHVSCHLHERNTTRPSALHDEMIIALHFHII